MDGISSKLGEHPVPEHTTCAPRRRFPGPTIYWSTKHLVGVAVHVPGRRQPRGRCTAPIDWDHHWHCQCRSVLEGLEHLGHLGPPPPATPLHSPLLDQYSHFSTHQ
jgi:hypothetical protein